MAGVLTNLTGVLGASSLIQAKQAAQTAVEQQAMTTALKGSGLDQGQTAAATDLVTAAGGPKSTLSSIGTFFDVTLPAAFNAAMLWEYQGLSAPITYDPTVSWFHMFFSYLPFILILTAILMYFAITRGWFKSVTSQQGKLEKVGGTLNAATSNAPPIVSEGFVDASEPMNVEESTLLNLQPLTIKHVGFMGPLPEGSFDAENATGQALRGGFRSFIFQIDYLESSKDPKKFPDPGIPTLIYRGDDGALLSTNSADINTVVKTIASIAFRSDVPNYTQPLIIYLHIIRTPSALRDPHGRISFLSTIATALKPITPNHLGMTPMGTFNRQKQESVLINTPLHALQGQVIIMCNADTAIFRTMKQKVNPADDLDFYVNMRVYLNSDDDTFGVTQLPPAGVIPSAVIVSLSKLLALSPEKKEAFAMRTKHQFIIAMPPALKNPTSAELDTAINTLGINMVPLDIFSDPIDTVKGLVGKYSNMTYRPIPSALRTVN